MIITETQRFVYSLLALTFATIVILVLSNIYALGIFLILIIIEFLALVELTKPSVINMAWSSNRAISNLLLTRPRGVSAFGTTSINFPFVR